jgi:hypothetical protein
VTNLLRSLFAARPATRANETTPISITDWARSFRPGQQVVFNGQPHQAFALGGSGSNGGLFEGNSAVFAVELKRLLVFSEARFGYQELRNGRPGDMFWTPDLTVLEEPWPGASLRDLLVRAELDAAAAGNSYWVDDPTDDRYVVRIDPQEMKVLTAAAVDPVSGGRVSEQLLGYTHVRRGEPVTIYEPDQVAHFRPIPHPGEQFIGMSWMSPCLPDIDADALMTGHRSSQLRRGGNLGYVVSLDPTVGQDEFDEFVEKFRRDHEGPENSGKTLFLGGGADVKTVGQSFAELALRAEQGATETRIASCGGVPPSVVGFSEGLQGSALNAGNYGAAKRNMVDGTMRPNWGAFAGSFASLMPKQAGARFWYEDRDIPFLREDVTDQAEIVKTDALTIRQLVDAGFEPDSVIAAVAARDLARLAGKHTGWFSVQLQQPGTTGKQPTLTPGGTS